MAKSPKKMTYARKGAKFREVSYDDMTEYLRVLRQNRDYLFSFEGVEFVDVGYRWEGEELTDEVAIRCHVREKDPDRPAEDCVPKQLAGFAVDVIRSDVQLHAVRPADLRVERRPLTGGLEIANAHSPSSGTLGAIVYDQRDGSPLALSNYHVLMGDRPNPVGERVNQPGSHLGRHEVGRVSRGISELDCAVASVGVPFSTTIPGVPGGVKGLVRPALGMIVVKVGASTGFTRGMVESVSLDAFTVVPEPNGEWMELSTGGDSGSVWVEETSHAAVGVHFAGENRQAAEDERAWSIRADVVSEELEVDFCRVATAPEYPAFSPALASDGHALAVAWVASEIVREPVDKATLRRFREWWDTERRRSRGRDYDTERTRSRGRDYDTERKRSRGRLYDTERGRSRGRLYDTERRRSRGRDYDTERDRSRGRDYDTERRRTRGHIYDTEGRATSPGDDAGSAFLVSLPEKAPGEVVVEHRWVNVQVIDHDLNAGPVTTLNVGSVGEVCLARFKNGYVLVWTSAAGDVRFRCSDDGLAWSPAEVVPESMTDHPPAAAVFDGTLVLAWHDTASQIWLSRSKNLSRWSEPVRVQEDLSGGPILAASADRLYLAGRARRGKRMWVRASRDGVRFNRAYPSVFVSDDTPGLCVHKERLHAAHVNGENRVVTASSRTGASWEDAVSLREWGRSSPVLGSWGEKLALAWADQWSGRLTLMAYDLG